MKIMIMIKYPVLGNFCSYKPQDLRHPQKYAGAELGQGRSFFLSTYPVRKFPKRGVRFYFLLFSFYLMLILFLFLFPRKGLSQRFPARGTGWTT